MTLLLSSTAHILCMAILIFVSFRLLLLLWPGGMVFGVDALTGESNRSTITWSKSTAKLVLALCAVPTPAAAARYLQYNPHNVIWLTILSSIHC